MKAEHTSRGMHSVLFVAILPIFISQLISSNTLLLFIRRYCVIPEKSDFIKSRAISRDIDFPG